MSYLDRLALIL